MIWILCNKTKYMIDNKKLQLIATELSVGVRKLNLSLAFITQSYFVAPKNISQNSTNYVIIKIPDK